MHTRQETDLLEGGFKHVVVLYYSTNCKYCKLVKKVLVNNLHKLVLHNVDTDGYPAYLPALPELVAFDADGNREETISGYRAATIFMQFLLKHEDKLL